MLRAPHQPYADGHRRETGAQTDSQALLRVLRHPVLVDREVDVAERLLAGLAGSELAKDR